MRQPRLYWEDFAPGDVIETERAPVTKEEILEFAQEFDPQPSSISMKTRPRPRCSADCAPAAGTAAP